MVQHAISKKDVSETTDYGPEMFESFCHFVAMFVQTMVQTVLETVVFFYKFVWCC